MQIIAITGKKGKTSVVRLISYIFENLGKKIISLDNDFYSENGKKIFNLEDSKNIWGIKYMARCPGRWLGIQNKNINNFDYFVTEAASGCYKYGLGYEKHDVGIFTNLDSSEPLLDFGKTKKKLAQAKGNFIFGSLKEKGIAVFDSDNNYILNEVQKYDKNFIKIGVGKKYMDSLNFFLKIEGSIIKVYRKNNLIFENDFKSAYITFDGLFFPSLQNIAVVLGVIFGKYYNNSEKTLFIEKTVSLINNYKPLDDGGRLALFKKEGKKILIDYAHDKPSFEYIIKLIKIISKNNYYIFFDGKKGTSRKKQFEDVIRKLKISNNKFSYINSKDINKNLLLQINSNYVLFLVSRTRNEVVNLLKY